MTTATLQELCNAVNEMDGLAQSGFGEIASLARLALLAMEQPKTYANGFGMDAVADVLSAITNRAFDINNCINVTAERVGCNYVDDAQRRRWDAWREADKSTTAGTAASPPTAAAPDAEQLAMDRQTGRVCQRLMRNGMSALDVAKNLGVALPTLYEYLKAASPELTAVKS